MIAGNLPHLCAAVRTLLALLSLEMEMLLLQEQKDFNCTNPLVAEARSLLEGIKLVIQNFWDFVVFETECNELVLHFNILEEAKDLFKSLSLWE